MRKKKQGSIRLGAPQMQLFGDVSPEGSTGVRGPITFVDPSPYDLYVGGQRLDEFLETTNQAWVFSVRKLLRELDWSGFEGVYNPKGRRPFHPAIMMGVIVLGVMEGVTSLRQLESRTRRDLAWWWVAGGVFPDHSSFGKFLSRHSHRITDELFESLTRRVLEITGSPTDSLAGDGTVVQAAVSRYKTLKLEAVRARADAARAKAAAHPDDDEVLEDLKTAESLLAKASERGQSRARKGKKLVDQTRISPGEPDAVVQRQKNGSHVPSYKPSVLATADRIVVAHAVHPTSETAVVEALLEQATRLSPTEPTQLLFDAGYFCSSIIALALSMDIDLLCPQGRSRGSWEKTSTKQTTKMAFKYDAVTDIYVCPQGRHLEPAERRAPRKGKGGHTIYRSLSCDDCPVRSTCCGGKGNRTVARFDDEEAKEALRQVMSHPKARARYSKRAPMVEPVFSAMRQMQKLSRFSRLGLGGVRLEFAIHAIGHNVSRCLAIQRRLAWLVALLLGHRSPLQAHQRIVSQP